MQDQKTKPVARTIRDFEVGEMETWPIERDRTVRNAASRVMLIEPTKEIVCNQHRESRTITAKRIK